jgi:hypothetical protein
MSSGMNSVHSCDVDNNSCVYSYAASVVMSISYGKTTPTAYTDPEVVAVNTALTRFGRTVKPGAYLVDTFPILRFVPGYLSQLKAWHQEEYALFDGQLDVVRRQMVRKFILVLDGITQVP